MGSKRGSITHIQDVERLAQERRLPLVMLLDGAGERTDNQTERYPNTPGDLQLLADIKGQVPVVTLVLGTSAGHGALAGMFADLIIMTQGSAMFSAGPPLVQAALGIEATPDELGGAAMHTARSGVAHNLAESEQDAFAMARYFLSLLPQRAGEAAPQQREHPAAAPRKLDNLVDIIPPHIHQPYDMREVLRALADSQSLFELQPDYGRSLLVALARIGGIPCLLLANQPAVEAGAIGHEGAHKARTGRSSSPTRARCCIFPADCSGTSDGSSTGEPRAMDWVRRTTVPIPDRSRSPGTAG